MLTLIPFPSATQNALIDDTSWASLAAGAEELPGSAGAHGARFLRVP